MTLRTRAPVLQCTQEILKRGYAVIEPFIQPAEVRAIRAYSERLWRSGEFRRARVGPGGEAEQRSEIRSDRIHWLEPELARGAMRRYLLRLEKIRTRLNATTFAGMFAWEGHLAVYPPGAFYARHLDRFERDDSRLLSTILYLNEGWEPNDGGALRLWLDDDPRGPSIEIAPRAGTLVAFWSDRFYHAVQPSNAVRMSVTGWFRTRPSGPALVQGPLPPIR